MTEEKREKRERAKRSMESYLASIKRCNEIVKEILNQAALDTII